LVFAFTERLVSQENACKVVHIGAVEHTDFALYGRLNCRTDTDIGKQPYNEHCGHPGSVCTARKAKEENLTVDGF
jgi:hypothetical protein